MIIANNTPLTDEDIELLDDLLLEYANDESDEGIVTVSDLDGYLTAIVSSPMLIQPNQWIPAIWAGKTPEWESEEQAQQFFDLLFRFYNELINSLRAGLDHYTPLFNYSGEDDYPVVDDWCFGYLYATKIANWQKLPSVIQPHLELIHAQTVIDDTPDPSLEEQKQLEQNLRQAAFEIYHYINEHLYQPFVKTNKVGVNQPCPCGSGKKYKKCCMN